MDKPTDRPRINITDKRGSGDQASPDRPEGQPRVVEETAPVAELDEAKQLAADRLDQLMRMKADFENFRKRELKEKTDLVERASGRIVERLLPVIDDLERALDAAQRHETDDAFVRGVELVAKQLHDVLAGEGLERVASGGPFDPHEHEAVMSAPGDVSEPTVLEIVRPGYKLKGKTIRPALVHVSVPEETPAEDGE